MAESDVISEEEIMAMAKARRARAQTEPGWGEVATNAVKEGLAGVGDAILNLPSNTKNVLQMGSEIMNAGYGPASPMAGGDGITDAAGEMTIPENTIRNSGIEYGLIDPALRGRMSPEQRMADTAIQGTVGALAGGGPKQALVAGLSAGGGQGVTEATGSDALGLATTMLTPYGASKISALNTSREVAKAKDAARKQVLDDARGLGFAVVPEGRAVDFANRPKLIKMMADSNQERTNDVARRYLGLPETGQLTKDSFDKIRKDAYRQGYEPLKGIGKVVPDNDFYDAIDKIEKDFAGQAGSFPNLVPKNIQDMTQGYLENMYDAGDIVDKLRTIRHRATKFIKSDSPENEEYGYALKAVGEAFEGLLERTAAVKGYPPELFEGYKEARKLIAKTHVIEGATNAAGQVSGKKLAKAYEKKVPLDEDMLKVAKFYSINQPKAGTSALRAALKPEFLHLAGASGGYAAATALGLPAWSGPLMAMGGFGAGAIGHEMLAAPMRSLMMTKAGQRNLQNDYSGLGIDPSSGALGGLMFESANQGEP